MTEHERVGSRNRADLVYMYASFALKPGHHLPHVNGISDPTRAVYSLSIVCASLLDVWHDIIGQEWIAGGYSRHLKRRQDPL